MSRFHISRLGTREKGEEQREKEAWKGGERERERERGQRTILRNAAVDDKIRLQRQRGVCRDGVQRHLRAPVLGTATADDDQVPRAQRVHVEARREERRDAALASASAGGVGGGRIRGAKHRGGRGMSPDSCLAGIAAIASSISITISIAITAAAAVAVAVAVETHQARRLRVRGRGIRV